MTAKKKTLRQKLFDVQKLLTGVEEDGFNSHTKKKYASHTAVKKAVHGACNEAGVLFMCSSEVRVTEGDGPRVVITADFYDPDSDEMLSREWVGIPPQSDDKKLASSQVMAQKFLLTSTFLIPVGDEIEAAGTETEPRKDPFQQQKKKAEAKKAASLSAADTFTEMSEYRTKRDLKPFSEKQWTWLVDEQGIGWLRAKDMTDGEIKDLVKRSKEKEGK